MNWWTESVCEGLVTGFLLLFQARSSVDLEGLQVNSSYSVEVQAVSYWGQIRLKSSKASVQFNTQLHNQTSALKLTHSSICAHFIHCYWTFLSHYLTENWFKVQYLFKFGNMIFKCFWKSLFCSQRLHLFDQIYWKNCEIFL